MKNKKEIKKVRNRLNKTIIWFKKLTKVERIQICINSSAIIIMIIVSCSADRTLEKSTRKQITAVNRNIDALEKASDKQISQSKSVLIYAILKDMFLVKNEIRENNKTIKTILKGKRVEGDVKNN